MKKAVIFDNDGVLVDTESRYFQANREILADYGVELTEKAFVDNLICASRGIWHLIGDADHDVDDLRARRDARYLDLLIAGNPTIQNVPETLDALSASYRMCIVSSSKRVHFDQIHRDSEYLHHFEFVILREDVIHSKPSPEPYAKALARLGLAADECVVIEDSYRGLQSAVAAGMECVVVRSRFTKHLDLTDASRIVDTIADLPAAIAEL